MITLRLSTVQDSLTGLLIRRFTWSEWSHVDICLPDGLLGAQMDGVKIRPYDYEPQAKVLYLQTDVLTPDQEALAESFWRAQIGKPYDFGAIAGFIIHRDWRNDKKWFCSELAAAGFSVAGRPLLNETSLDRVSPRDVSLSPFLVPCGAPFLTVISARPALLLPR